MRFLLLALIALTACEEGPAYDSDRCKEMREHVRDIEAHVLQFPNGSYTVALIDKRSRLVQENPECFDPTL